jgi:penicillin-binding protein 1A
VRKPPDEGPGARGAANEPEDGNRVLIPAPRRRRKWRRRYAGRHAVILGVAIVVTLATASAALAVAVVIDRPSVVPGCDMANQQVQPSANTSLLTADDGTPLGAVPSARRREPVPMASMSRWLPLATVAIEDRRFWQHGALDYPGIVRAAIADLRHGGAVQGGSTITQQLARVRYLGPAPITLSRKLKEACLALGIAKVTPKQQILEQYLNDVFYGNASYGVEAASWTYFSRPSSDLTIPQAALIAGLPQAPTDDDPFTHPQAALRRRGDVLGAMLKAKDITPEQYRAALASPLGVQPGGRRYNLHVAPTFASYALQTLQQRYGRAAANEGLRVRTTLDPKLQRMADRAIKGWLNQPGDPSAALVAIDPSTGAVKAMSTTNPSGAKFGFNFATQAHRQAGSAFKVFTLTTALEQGIPLSSVWSGPPSITIPSCPSGNGGWNVHNFADERAGTMDLASALAGSVNTIFAQVAAQVGPKNIVATAHRMGITSPLPPVCSITLGVGGVTPLEMTDGYATIDSGGVRHDATPFARITGPGGQTLERLDSTGTRVVPETIARRVTYAMSGVILAGTGTAADPGRPAAGKTGTAENEVDAWFCGFVPQLTACVWMGFPQGEVPMQSVAGFSPVVGGSVPARIWHDFMVAAMQGQPVESLPQIATSQVQLGTKPSTNATGNGKGNGSRSNSGAGNGSTPGNGATTTGRRTRGRGRHG